MDNSAVILCGGLGNRLRGIISDKPKVLAQVGDNIFIDIVIKNVLQYGFKDIILCTGYLKDKIKDHFNNNDIYNNIDHQYFGQFNIKFSEEKELLGTGGALKNAESLITGNNFLVINGDSICNVNLKDFLNFHKNKSALISIVLSTSSLEHDYSNNSNKKDVHKEYGYIHLDRLQRITDFNEKSNNENNSKVDNNGLLINAGIYIMNKEVFSCMPNKYKFSLEYDLFPEIIKTNNCYGYITNGKIIDIGTPERFKMAQDYFTEKNIINNIEEKTRKIRRHIINMIFDAGSGHPGGSLSCVDILTTLYFHTMRHNPFKPTWEDRDRFILSKGHAVPALYATLAEVGYFPIEELKTLRKFGSRLQGHPEAKLLPGIEVSTGSLGQGLSIASGIAISMKLDKKDSKVYVLIGDGECNEGQIWETAMLSNHYKLNNLIVIIDRNNYQIDGPTEKIISLEPLADKWKSFGWNVIDIDGHNIKEIIKALDTSRTIKYKPTVIIANTIKGKGINFMENNNDYHGRSPTKEEYILAMEQLKDD